MMEIGILSETLLSVALILILITSSANPSDSENNSTVIVNDVHLKCDALLMGQYKCAEPEIDPDTQQARGCDPDTRTVKVSCMPAPQVICDGIKYNGSMIGFRKTVPCKWTNGKSFETALLLSIFLGMFGIDRFYLGYPAIGLLKFSTLGFFFLGQLIDVLLIASQVVTPADGSDYVIDYYGAGLIKIMPDNYTYIKPREEYEL